MASGPVLQIKVSLCTTASIEAHGAMADGSSSVASDTDTELELHLHSLSNRAKVLEQNNVPQPSCLKAT